LIYESDPASQAAVYAEREIATRARWPSC